MDASTANVNRRAQRPHSFGSDAPPLRLDFEIATWLNTGG
jgi:hypothetical protein